jgi:hypothetical protein
MAKKEMAKAEPVGALAPPAYLEKGSQGLENMRKTDIVYPRVKLLQSLSPEVQDSNSGLHPGDLINSVTLETVALGEEKKTFTPLLFWPEWIEWGDRDAGGGIIAQSRDPQGELAKRASEKKDVGGKTVWAVTEYLTFLALLFDPDLVVVPKVEDAVCISCAKSNFMMGKRLLNLARLRGAYPLYAGAYTLQSVKKPVPSKPNTVYWKFNFDNSGWAPEPVYALCKEAYERLKDMTVSASDPAAAEDHAAVDNEL